MERRRRHLECPRRRGGCFVIEGRTCQKDLVPIWLKRQGRVKLFKHVGKEVLIHGLIFLCVSLLWNLVR
ncbi:F-box domain protein (AFU_orthologue; AFUA_1G14050) [Aspergillus udagawae]|nr:F-box domain protein (AFU_orthologue; AFUA_1G14050) [Aspergillus udagawae]